MGKPANNRAAKEFDMDTASLVATLPELTDDFLWCVDTEYRLVWCNSSFRKHTEQILGYKLKTGESVFQPEVPDEIRKKWLGYFSRVLDKGERVVAESQTQNLDDRRFIEFTLHPLKNLSGKVIGVMVMGRDITSHKSIAEQLVHSNELLNRNEKLTLSGSWEWDIAKQSMLWSEQVYLLHEMDPGDFEPGSEEHIALSVQCYHPDYRPIILEAFQKCMKEGISYDLVVPFTTAKGRQLWVRTIGQPLYLEGKIARVSGIIQDITLQKEKEDAIRNSEDKFRALVEQASEMLFLHDMHGRIVDVNRAAIKETGFSREELLRMSVWDIDPDAEHRRDKEVVWDVLSQQTESTIEARHKRKDNSVYFVEVNVSKITFGGEEYILALARNVSKRKLAEEALHKSEKRANALINAIPDLIFRMNKDGVYLDYRASFDDLYFRQDTIIGKRNRDITPSWFADLVDEKLACALQSQEVQLFEYQLPISEKGECSYEARLFPSGKDEVIAIVRDITERKKNEAAIRETHANARAIMEATSDILILIDKQGIILDCNQAHATRFDLDREELIGMSLFDFLPKDLADKRMGLIKEVVKNGTPASGEDIRNGRTTEYFIFPVFDGSGQVGRVAVFARDITDKKQAAEELVKRNQELKEINAAKDKFFSIIAHDLRSPFSSLLGFSELLRDKIKENDLDGIDQYAAIIFQSSQQALNLLNNLLEWSRAQTGRIEFNPEYIEMVNIVQESIDLLQITADEKSIHFQTDLPSFAPVFADKAMVNIILRNMISNAIKFSFPGGIIKVSVRINPQEMEVSVIDTGIGISKENQRKLFRMDESFTTPGTNMERGTGLGLILCKEFVERHGGRIFLESEPGKGSSFSFIFPRARR